LIDNKTKSNESIPNIDEHNKMNSVFFRICHLDTDVPKLFSAENNMDPGAAPSELYVTYIRFINS